MRLNAQLGLGVCIKLATVSSDNINSLLRILELKLTAFTRRFSN